MKRFYKLYTYDVWGNKKDGYEVNNVFGSNTIIELDDECTDADVIRALKKAGEIKPNYRFNSFRIDGESKYTLYITYTRTEYPLCELRCQDTYSPANTSDPLTQAITNAYSQEKN